MKRLLIGIIVMMSIILPACGDGSSSRSTQNSAANGRGNSAVTNAANNTALSQPASQPPGNNAGPNANGPTDSSLMAAKNRKIEAMRQSGSDPSSPKTDVETLLRQSTKPAPENSEFSVALTDVLIERRTFLNHPILARVEKVTNGPYSSIAVTTTDGGTIELPGTAIEKLSTASVASILRAARLEPPKSSPRTENPTR